MSGFFLVLAAFLASAVEMVEATTIVLAVGVTRGWRSPLLGVVVALLALAVVVAALGPALDKVPLDALRLVVGGLLLVFGLQWLRKAILRAGGRKALHDEDAIYAEELRIAGAQDVELRVGTDWYAFTLAFKAVFLEGLEVVFIVLTFGANQGNVGLAALGALAAFVTVVAVAVVVHAPLSRVPENTLKFAVGSMLVTFGAFWGGEGAGVAWPGGEVAIVGVLVVVVVASWAMVMALRGRLGAPITTWRQHAVRR